MAQRDDMQQATLKRQSDRRTEILDAAERCFARSGFHQASMQDICGEAAMSAGNLYRYFPSKEALIAGICERNRAEAVESFSLVDEAPDFFEGLAELARHHLVDRSDIEVGSVRRDHGREPASPRHLQALSRRSKTTSKTRIAAMLKRAAERGEIRADLDVDAAASVLMVLGDGMSWRRSVDPGFDAETALADDFENGSLPARQAGRKAEAGAGDAGAKP